MKIEHPRAVLNLQCFELCALVCEGLIGETGVGAIACILGCKIVCDPDKVPFMNAPGN